MNTISNYTFIHEQGHNFSKLIDENVNNFSKLVFFLLYVILFSGAESFQGYVAKSNYLIWIPAFFTKVTKRLQKFSRKCFKRLPPLIICGAT